MKLSKISLLLIIISLFSSCSVKEIMKSVGVEKPTVSFEKVNIENISFDDLDLLFDFKIDNPNAIGINLSGFDYDLKINNSSFIAGDQQKGLSIKSNGSSVIQIPVSFTYQELLNAYNSLKEKDSTDYSLAGSFLFKLPVLGNIKVPYSTAGTFPVIKIPSISVQDLKISNMSIMGADVVLKLEGDNPNSFNLGVSDFNYALNVAGTEWVKSKLNNVINLRNEDKSIIEIPLHLNFLQIGNSVYKLLSGKSDLNYNLTGDFRVNSPIKFLNGKKLSFNKDGVVNIK